MFWSCSGDIADIVETIMALQLEQELRGDSPQRDHSGFEARGRICAHVVSLITNGTGATADSSFSTHDVDNELKLQEGYRYLMAFNEPGTSLWSC
jgi:hypothetical protein